MKGQVGKIETLSNGEVKLSIYLQKEQIPPDLMAYNFETVTIKKGEVEDVDRLEFYTGMKQAFDVFADIMSQEIDVMRGEAPSITASKIEAMATIPSLKNLPNIGSGKTSEPGEQSTTQILCGPSLESIMKTISESPPPKIAPEKKLSGNAFIGEGRMPKEVE